MRHKRIGGLVAVTMGSWLLGGLLVGPAQAQKPEESKKPAAVVGRTASAKVSGEKTSKGRPAPAAATVQLRKELPGEFTYQFIPRSGEPTAPTPLPAPASSDNLIALTLPPGMTPAETTLQVLDAQRGNLARIRLTTTGVLPLTESQFRYVQVVNVPIQAKGKPVTDAQVTLSGTETKFRQSVLLHPGDKGVATFRAVPLGEEVTVTVTYGANPPEKQSKTLTRDHPAEGYTWPAIEISWADVRTLDAPASAAAVAAPPALRSEGEPTGRSARSAPEPPSGIGFLGSIGQMVVSLLFLGAVGYGLYWAYATGRLKTLLDRLGIQTSVPVPEGGPAANPFTTPAPSPIAPITEGTADPFVRAPDSAGSGEPVGYASVAPRGRLIGTMGTYAGSLFSLTGPTLEIGRDSANTVVLANDSNVSRRHATLQWAEGQYILIDNGSSNGTFVNGVRIPAQTPQPLRSGDEVQIGRTRFRFEG